MPVQCVHATPLGSTKRQLTSLADRSRSVHSRDDRKGASSRPARLGGSMQPGSRRLELAGALEQLQHPLRFFVQLDAAVADSLHDSASGFAAASAQLWPPDMR